MKLKNLVGKYLLGVPFSKLKVKYTRDNLNTEIIDFEYMIYNIPKFLERKVLKIDYKEDGLDIWIQPKEDD